MSNKESVSIDAEKLTAMIAATFVAAGASQAEGQAIGQNLVEANLAGHDSHGVVRVPRYLRDMQRGHMKFGQTVETLIDGGAFALLDGHFGFGQVVGRQALDIGLQKAKEHGIGLIALRQAGHLGRIGAWAELACEAGMVSIHFVNVARSMLVAPFGASQRRMSTAPVTIGIVNPSGDNFILDFATSRIAEGKALIALKGGPKPPEGSLVNDQGRYTADPHALYGDVEPGEVPNPRSGSGALVAMGDHKGSGLAIACELLAGALTGSGASGPGEGPYNGMLSFYVNPTAIDDGHDFGPAVADYIDFVRSAAPVAGGSDVKIPGDPERIARADRGKNGVPLPSPTWQSLVDAATEFGVTDIPEV